MSAEEHDQAPARAASGAPQPRSPGGFALLSEVCALALATTVVASLPTALRVSREGGNIVGGWIASSAVLLLPLALVFWSARAAGRGFRMLTGRHVGRRTAAGFSLWIGLFAPLLVVFAAVLKTSTNHRGLGGATFGVLAAGLAIFTALVAARLLSLGRRLVERGVPANALAVVVGVVAIGPLFLVLLPLLGTPQVETHAPLVAAAVIDTVIVGVAAAVAATFELRGAVLEHARKRGAIAFGTVLLAGFGWLSVSQPLGVALRQGGGLSSALLRGLEAWTDRDGDGVGSYFGGGDCDEGDPRRYPGAADDTIDGVDQDCDGADGPLARGDQAAAPPPPPAAAPAGAPKLPSKPDLVFVTLDTTRADRTSAYGYEKDTTPTLKRLAAQGIRFDRAYAPGSDTQRALMPLLASKLLEDVPKDRREWPTLRDEADTVAERLARAGYQTAAVSSFQWISKERGFTQGFELFHAAYEDAHPEREVTGPHALRAARSHLVKLLADSRPFYLWVHLFDPHEQYKRHRGHDFGRGSSGAYDSEIAFTDAQLAALFGTLEESERGKRAVVVVSGSHGEGFGEHGSRGHGSHLYDEVIRVPLILRAPGLTSGRVVPVPVSAVDVVPTLLELAGASTEGAAGRSLVKVLGSEELAPQPVFARADRRYAVIDGPLKLIRTDRRGKPRYWLFDLAKDPEEKRDIGEERPEDLARLSALLEGQFGKADGARD